MTGGRTKCTALVNQVLFPYSMEPVQEDLKNDVPFSVATDASNKEMNQKFFQYIEEWSETNSTGNNSFQWHILTLSHVNWADIEHYVEFLTKEMPDTKINANCLFEIERRLNVYLNSNKMEQLENQHAEIDKRWVEILNHFKNEHFPYDNLVILVEFTLCFPRTNAESFSIGNDFRKSET
ncbi:uncharacterized protein TNCV_758481 [Trichonephila clavipes]|nr:uncharacterized protein TNCV_758481 [Trichonephila clavipes]